MVSDEDRRRMKRLAMDLERFEKDDPVDLDGLTALREWLNNRRRERGLPPVEDVQDDIPELGIIKRAKALGMVRPRSQDR